MATVGFGMLVMDQNGGRRFWSDWNELEWPQSVLDCLEWIGMKDVCFDRLDWLRMEDVLFGLPGMDQKSGRRFWPDWNGFDWPKSVLACICHNPFSKCNKDGSKKKKKTRTE
jgi:hypothetical protein